LLASRRVPTVEPLARHPKYHWAGEPAFDDPRHALAASDEVYRRILDKAAAGRRHEFRLALERGMSIDEVAATTGLEPVEVRGVLDGNRSPSIDR
jgi:DNA-directed RNA polymerase specialized sigma24 family protein